MILEIEGWRLNDYDGTFSPDAENRLGDGWLSLSTYFGACDVAVDTQDDSVQIKFVPIAVLKAFIEMCEKWIAKGVG